MSDNNFIVNAVKGEPSSLTSIAFNTGVTLERQRIIKLLEEVAVDEDGCFSERMPETLIALIKGENK